MALALNGMSGQGDTFVGKKQRKYFEVTVLLGCILASLFFHVSRFDLRQ